MLESISFKVRFLNLPQKPLEMFFCKCNRFLHTLYILISELYITGSEIYQETLAKALAKHFSAKLLVVDSLLLPVSLFLSACFF